jgi:antitoxin VapB
MTVTIRNELVERLLHEVVALTGESRTEAIRRALEERRDRLVRFPSDAHPADRLRRVLERESWPTIPPGQVGRRQTKSEEETLLGYGPDGV